MAVKLIIRSEDAAPGTPPFAEHEFDEPNIAIGSFAGLFDSLRTEEEFFRFEIVNATGEHQYVGIDNTEMLIGWDETGRQVSCDAASVRDPRASVRAKWSGVVVQPYGPGTVEVNGEPVETARRLRNGDRLTLLPTAVATDSGENLLIFHEPAILVALGPLLSQQFPLPVAPVQDGAAAEPTQESPILRRLEPVPAAGPVPVSPRPSYFGYFTLGEVVIMYIGTFMAAVTVFLLMASM